MNANLINIDGRNEPGGWGSGIKTRLSNFVEISHCKSHNNWGEGIACARTTNVYVHDNEVYDNYSVNIYLDNVINGRYLQNLCYATLGDPTYWRTSSPSAGFGIGAEYYPDDDYAKAENIVIANNIVLNTQGLYLDDNRSATEPLIADFKEILFCNNSIVGFQGDLSTNVRAIRIDFAGYNNGHFDLENVYLYNNLIAVDPSLSTGSGQIISGSPQPLPPSMHFGFNFWTKDPQKFSFYNYPFNSYSDYINPTIVTSIDPTSLREIVPTNANGLLFPGVFLPALISPPITTDFNNLKRLMNYNAGALLPRAALPPKAEIKLD